MNKFQSIYRAFGSTVRGALHFDGEDAQLLPCKRALRIVVEQVVGEDVADRDGQAELLGRVGRLFEQRVAGRRRICAGFENLC